MSFKAVIFDLDGTLLDTLQDIAESANQVLASHDFPPHSVEKYRYFVGEGLQVLVERILPEEQRTDRLINQFVGEFKEVYNHTWNATSCMYDGIAEMLNQLKDAEIRLAILSNKPHEFTKICVEELLPDWHFEPLFGSRSGVPKNLIRQGQLRLPVYFSLNPQESCIWEIRLQTCVRLYVPECILLEHSGGLELHQSWNKAVQLV